MLRIDDAVVAQGSFRLTADLEVAAGSRVAVLGPSGAGKSTLLMALAGFVPLAAGCMIWEGTNLTDLPPGERPLSLLFQDQNLFPHMTARQNVGLGLRPDLRLTSAEWARVDAALAKVGLEGYGLRRPASLSGGQQSRVALARVLLRARPLLLLDEPFSALGPALKAEMLELVQELVTQEGLTVLMVTHDPADARRFAPETIVVADGRALPPRPTPALLDNPPETLAAYLGSGLSFG